MAVMALSIVVLASVGVFSIQLNAAAQGANQDDVKVIDASITKSYGYTFFMATLKSDIDMPLYLDLKVLGEDGVNTFSFSNVLLPPNGEVTVTQDGWYGDHFDIGKSYVIQIGDERALADTVPCKGTQLTSGKIILLAISGFTGDPTVNATAINEGVEDTANKLGIGVSYIRSMSEWNALLSNPEQGVMVVNPYGNIVPAPSWGVDDPQGYLNSLNQIIEQNGWTWIQVGGDPFSTVSNGTSSSNLGDSGLEWVLNSSNVNIHKGGTEYLDQNVLTNDAGTSMSYMLSVSNITQPSSRMWFDWTIVMPPSETPTTKYTFYENPSDVSQTGVRSLTLGSGYYVHWGSPCYSGSHNANDLLSDYYNGAYALMSAIYTNTR